jgi:hypothetical protein
VKHLPLCVAAGHCNKYSDRYKLAVARLGIWGSNEELLTALFPYVLAVVSYVAGTQGLGLLNWYNETVELGL